jgi:hypothetical protein
VGLWQAKTLFNSMPKLAFKTTSQLNLACTIY